MKHIVFFIALIFSSAIGMAQSPEAMKKIESARIALITERLDLTPEQAQQFWPIYNQYSKERMALRREMRDMRAGVDMKNMSEEEGKMLMQKNLELRERELKIDQDYAKKFQKVISSQQIMQLRGAEHDFKKMLLERLEQRKQQQERQQQMMERRQQYMQRRDN